MKLFGFFKKRDTYESEDFNDDDIFDEEEESLSADDAALIWLSNGMDEDYTFGYSEEELSDTLKDD